MYGGGMEAHRSHVSRVLITTRHLIDNYHIPTLDWAPTRCEYDGVTPAAAPLGQVCILSKGAGAGRWAHNSTAQKSYNLITICMHGLKNYTCIISQIFLI